MAEPNKALLQGAVGHAFDESLKLAQLHAEPRDAKEEEAVCGPGKGAECVITVRITVSREVANGSTAKRLYASTSLHYITCV